MDRPPEKRTLGNVVSSPSMNPLTPSPLIDATRGPQTLRPGDVLYKESSCPLRGNGLCSHCLVGELNVIVGNYSVSEIH